MGGMYRIQSQVESWSKPLAIRNFSSGQGTCGRETDNFLKEMFLLCSQMVCTGEEVGERPGVC